VYLEAKAKELRHMAPSKTRVRGRSLFRQADVVKAMRSVRSAKEDGFEIGGVEIGADGTIRILSKTVAGHGSGTAFENWIAKHNAPQT
jgi:hypothetical protein